MRMSLPSNRPGQMLAVTITLFAVLLVWFAAISPLVELFSENAEALARRRVLLHHMTDLVDTLPALQAAAGIGGTPGGRVNADTGAGIPDGSFLDGSTDAVAGAALQQRIQEMAAGLGAVLSSTEALPATPVSGYRRIALRISLSAPWPVLIGLLQAVQQASPRMLIDDLQAHGTRTLTPNLQLPLDAGFTILAFRLDPAAPAGKPK